MDQNKENDKKKSNIFSFIFGSYTPPGFILFIIDAFKKGHVSRGIKSFFSKIGRIIKKRPAIFIIILLLAPLYFGGQWAFNLWKGSKPQPIVVSYEVRKPRPNDYTKKESFPLQIKFNGSVAHLEEIGKIQSEGIDIIPALNGTWTWESDNLLVFTPQELWEIGTEYEVLLSKELFPEHIEVKKLEYRFKTDSFSSSLRSGEFYIDPENSKIKRVLTQINFNYPVDSEGLRDKIEIVPKIKSNSGSLKSGNHAFDLSFSEDKLIAYIVSEPVGMPANNVEMEIILLEGVGSSFGGNLTTTTQKRSVTIPGASNYVRVNSLEFTLVKDKDQNYEQVIYLETKGEINSKTLLDNLEVWELPKDRPELPGLKKSYNHRWRNTEEMVPEVISKAKKVKLTHIPNERDISSINSFKIDIQPNKYIFVKLKEGTRFYGDYFLGKDYGEIIKINEYPKEVSILSEGSLLSLSGEKKITFMSRGVSSLNVEIARIRPDDINHLVTQSNGRLDNINFHNYNFNEDNISEKYSKRININSNKSLKSPSFSSFSLEPFLKTIPEKNLRNGIFILKVSDNRSRGRSDKRLIMVSDLGFFIKKNTNSTRDIFVQSISTGRAVDNAIVEVWGKNGNPVFKGSTSITGRVTIPSLSSYRNENTPTVFVIKKGNDLSFMPYEDNGQRLNYSNFDVGGVYGAQDPKKLSAFIFSDRGIYRPGDKFNIAAIIKAGDWNINLQGTPLEVAITDPKGSEIYTKRVRLDSSGFTEINYKTQDYSPTGRYTASLYVIKSQRYREFLGSTTIKIEEFLPDTLKVNTTFNPSASAGWVSPRDLKGNISVKNLFGTPAAGNDLRLQLVLNPGYQRFTKFRDYRFFDPFLKSKSYEEFLGSYKTDDNGEFQTEIDLSKFEDATYNVTLMSEAFEKNSGRNVSGEASILVSPAEYLLGYKSDGSLNHINKNSVRNLKLIAVNSILDSVKVDNLRFRISETKYISSLIKQPNGVYKYQSKKKNYQVSEKSISVIKNGSEIKLPTVNDGNFFWEIVKDDETVLLSGNFTVIGENNIERSLERSAELEISLNKGDFKPGEEIEIFIKGPYKGSGLITIERDKVYKHKWFTANGESTTQRITVPNNLEGNGYISVALVRSQDSKEIYMSPLSYGAYPFSVSKDSKINKIDLDIPTEALPGEDFPIKYKTSDPGKIVVIAVDMGILQVANYSTPDPLSHFFKKRALEVETSQILDLILPEFSIAQSLSAIGGGGGEDYLQNNINPFKRKNNTPVAFWSGILDADSKERTINYKVPEHFNGTLKVMAVAVSKNRIGSTDKESIIRSPFVIQPNVPTLASPGDTMNISVNVTNVKSGSGSNVPVSLTVVPSEHIKIIGESEVTHRIDEGKDETYQFKIEITNTLGAAQLEFIAKGADENVKLNSYLSVRPPMPYQTFVDTGVIRKDSAKVNIDRVVYDEFAKRNINASYLPMGMALGLETYLSDYPYGCTEQITSGTFPKLFPSLVKNNSKDSKTLTEEIDATISILQARQKNDGSFGIWTSLSDNHYVVDSHVMFFLTMAKNRGYFVPQTLMDKGLNNITTIAKSKISGDLGYTKRAFAIYILTLNEVVTTSFIEALENDLKDIEGWKNSYTGLYLSGSYSLLKQQNKALSILKSVTKSMKKSGINEYYDSLYFTSLYLYMLSEYAPERLGKVSEELLLEMADNLTYRRFSTYSSSMTLMAIDSFLRVTPSAEKGEYTFKEKVGEEYKELILKGEDIAKGNYNRNATEITIDSSSDLNLFYQITNGGFSTKPPEERHKSIEISRSYLNGKDEESTSYKLGDEVSVRLRFRSIDRDRVSNIAIVEMIPSGFEIDIESVRKNSSLYKPDYVDVREDRIVIYGDFTKNFQEYTYNIRAINTGNYSVPPSYGESMYDQEINSIKPMPNITID